jgi:glycosyltransferase involved in cell wall biosynthesis
VNQHGVSGLVVEPGDVEGLAAAMRRLGRDAGERTRLGEGAVTRATSHFSRARMLTSFKNIVEQLVEQPVRVPALAGTDSA